jgi:hypothetical protein
MSTGGGANGFSQAFGFLTRVRDAPDAPLVSKIVRRAGLTD